jgi:hypothetical protein
MGNNWGTIYHKYVRKGYDNGYAAYMADKWEKRKKKNKEHITDIFCWCSPYLDYTDPITKEEVWVHNDE